jgi:hypothetical protein
MFYTQKCLVDKFIENFTFECEQDSVDKRTINKIVRAVTKRDFGRLDSGEIFLLWDMLGVNHERNALEEVLYAYLPFAGEILDDGKEAIKKVDEE